MRIRPEKFVSSIFFSSCLFVNRIVLGNLKPLGLQQSLALFLVLCVVIFLFSS